MKSFISLEEFLLLQDPTYNYKRSAHMVIRRAEQWVAFYQIAKASYDKYGDAGPPIGSRVVTLVPGHGGGMGMNKILKGICERDPRFFILAYDNQDRGSLALCAQWWNEFRVYDDRYVICSGRTSYWQGDCWSDVWLTAIRYDDKSTASEVLKNIPALHKYVEHAENNWTANLR